MQPASEAQQSTQQISALLNKYDKATSRGQAFRRAAANTKATQEELLSDLETLFTNEILNEKDQNPKKLRTALHQAVIHKVKPAIKFLLGKKAFYAIEDYEHHTALYYATQCNDPEIKQLFLEQLEKDNPSSHGKTPLHHAVEQKDRDKVDLLLKLGADYNKKDNNGETPLCYLAKINDEQIKKLLLMKLTNDLLPKINEKYKSMTDAERNKEVVQFRQIKSLLKTKDQNISNLIQFILLALLTNSPANCYTVDVTRATEKAKEFMSMVNLIKTFASYDNWKSIIDIYKTTYKDNQLPNYCGLLCHEMIFALLMYPAFLFGKISLSSLYFDDLFSGGDHEVVIINGTHLIKNESTILCNPFRNKNIIGSYEIHQYFGALTGSEMDHCPHNIFPRYHFFKSDQELYETLLSQVKQAFLLSTQKPANESLVIQFLIEKARKILAEQPEAAQRAFACTRGRVGNMLEESILKLLRDNNPTSAPLAVNSNENNSRNNSISEQLQSSLNMLYRKK